MDFLLQTLILIILMYSYVLFLPNLSIDLDRLVTKIFALVFILIITFRPLSVPDTMSYYEFFNQIEFYKFSFSFGRTYLGFENGFCNYSRIIYLIYPNFRFFLFVVGSTSFLLNFSALLKIKSVVFSIDKNSWFPLLILYIPYFGFLYSGIILRAGIAFGFCMYSFYYLYKQSIAQSIIFFFFGLWFHNSAFIFVIVLLLFYIPRSISNKQIFKLSFLIIALYSLRIFNLLSQMVLYLFNFITKKISFLNFMNHYVDGTINSSFRWAIFIVLLFYLFSSYIFSRTSSQSVNKYQNIMFPLMMIIAILGGLPVILRGSDYFLILLLPLFLKLLSGNNQSIFVSRRITFFSCNDRLFLAVVNILISSVLYLLFLRVASLI